MKIIFFANTSWNIYNYRIDLVKHFQEAGHQVLVVSPQDRYTPIVRDKGIHWSDIHLSQHGMNPFEDLRTLWEIFRIYRQEKPDIVSHFTVKSVLYGSLAAKFTGTKQVINNITGLGFLFSDSRIFIHLLRFIVLQLYRSALKDTQVVFQNPDDKDFFIKKKIIHPNQAVLIAGSGVTLPELVTTTKQISEEIKIILPSRMVWSKGIQVFVDAARMIVPENPNIRFILVGEIPDHDRTKIAKEEIDAWCANGWVEYWGWKDDMADVYQQADIVCLPTLYGEGIPKSLIEGAAYQCPLIASDNGGCREIVHAGINGFLVPQNDAQALADAISLLVNNPGLRMEMGNNGRDIVKERFTTESIIKQCVQIYLQAEKNQ